LAELAKVAGKAGDFGVSIGRANINGLPVDVKRNKAREDRLSRIVSGGVIGAPR